MRERWVALPLGIQVAILGQALLIIWVLRDLPRVLASLTNGPIGPLVFVGLVGVQVLMAMGLLTRNRLAFFLSGLGACNLLLTGVLNLATGTVFLAVMGFIIGYGLWSGRDAFLGPTSPHRPPG